MASHHELIKGLAEQLEEWDYKFDRIQHRLADLPREVSEKVDARLKQLDTLRHKLSQAQKEIQEASQEAVEEIEKDLEELWKSVTALFDEVEVEVKVETV